MTFIARAAVAAALVLGPSGAAIAQDWKPAEPVTIVVPWAAGGSTDSIVRVLAKELTEAVGQTFVVVNQPGASGSVGTRSVWDAPHDGKMMASGAAADLGAYPVLGMLDVPLQDWRLYLAVQNPQVVSVGKDAPWKDFGELLEHMKTEEVTDGTAGLTSAGAIALQAIQAAAPDIKVRQITYEGGNPAATSTVAGETQMTTQTAVEQVDMIRAGRLRPLAVLSDKPLEIKDFGEVPPITNWLPDVKFAPNYFGIFLPADSDPAVIAGMDKVWAEHMMDSQALRDHAVERASLYDPSFGDEAQAKAMPALSNNTWQQFEAGTAPNSPEKYGYPKPE